MKDLAGKVAIVTGAGSGIGRAAALALADTGAHIVSADLDPDTAADTADMAAARGVTALAISCDVSSDADFQRLHGAVADRFGRWDIVMHNAGRLSVGPPDAIPLAEWRRVMDINLLSVVRGNQLFLPAMLARGSGHIVVTASFAGLFPYAYDRLPYAASKAALVGMAEGLALYLRPLGIGVTCLCPGPVATNISKTAEVWGGDGRRRGPGPQFAKMTAEEIGAQVVDAIRSDKFFLPSHPDVRDLMIRRAEDPDAFIDAQIAGFDQW